MILVNGKMKEKNGVPEVAIRLILTVNLYFLRKGN